MEGNTFTDFLNTLDDTERHVTEAVYGHITNCYPEYKPFDIRPMNKNGNEWALNFRKKPKVGKALCSLYSRDGKLFVQVIPLGFMDHELLLRQNEFNEKICRFILISFCKKCNTNCDYRFRQYYYLNGRLQATTVPWCRSSNHSPDDVGYYGYGSIGGLTVNDIDDLLRLLDMMSRYMNKDPRETRGNDYLETSVKRCGNIEIISLEQTELDIDDFELSDYADPKKLNKYVSVYHLTPMGAHSDDFWYFHDDKAVCGIADNDYSYTVIPEGRYATVAISDPFSFSAWRSWNYIAKWLYENNMAIRPIDFGGTGIPYIAKFCRQNGGEYMSVYVPV